jgi:predicted ribosome quality control (RQC) complex YloA/Tae2 family protein
MFEAFWPVLETERRRTQLAKLVRRALRRTERAIDRVKTEIEDSTRADEYRHRGQLLLTRQESVPRGRAEATITDYDGVTPITVRLDPSLGVQQNAEVFFRKARKAERRGVKAPRRLKVLEAEAERLRRVASDISDASEERLSAMEKEIPMRDAERSGRPGETQPRFRTYTVSGGWEVLVGKSSRDNDALTHKLARPGDLWFHARQVPGSHVILRCSESKAEPDRQAILEAAAIAAYHSKAGKSSKVSVCYTEKRHVRRARGGQPGEAAVSREKVVMVRPSLPES